MRTEVEYAVDMGRSVVGVVVEQNYRPDGWIARHIPGMQYNTHYIPLHEHSHHTQRDIGRGESSCALKLLWHI